MQYIKDSLKFVGMISFLLTSMIVNAQEKINIDKGEIKTWFETYWMWVVGGVVLLILLIALMGRSRRIANGTRKTTTVVKDEQGRTQSVTTTEEPIKLS